MTQAQFVSSISVAFFILDRVAAWRRTRRDRKDRETKHQEILKLLQQLLQHREEGNMAQLKLIGTPREILDLLGELGLLPDLSTKVDQILTNTENIMALVKIEEQELVALNQKAEAALASEQRQEERLNGLLSAQDTTISDLRAEIVALQNADNGIPAATLQPALDLIDQLNAQQDAFKAAPVVVVEPVDPPVDPLPTEEIPV